jgi:hypothetical protein
MDRPKTALVTLRFGPIGTGMIWVQDGDGVNEGVLARMVRRERDVVSGMPVFCCDLKCEWQMQEVVDRRYGIAATTYGERAMLK